MSCEDQWLRPLPPVSDINRLYSYKMQVIFSSIMLNISIWLLYFSFCCMLCCVCLKVCDRSDRWSGRVHNRVGSCSYLLIVISSLQPGPAASATNVGASSRSPSKTVAPRAAGSTVRQRYTHIGSTKLFSIHFCRPIHKLTVSVYRWVTY